MRSSAARHVLVLAAATLAAALSFGPHSQSEAAGAQTKVILNGKAVPVHFNDGDTFSVQAGEYKDASARLAGFNTLESIAPTQIQALALNVRGPDLEGSEGRIPFLPAGLSIPAFGVALNAIATSQHNSSVAHRRTSAACKYCGGMAL